MARQIVNLEKLTEAQEALQAAVDLMAEAVAVVTVGNTGEPTKRITIEVGETLHHRIKLDCVNRRVNLTDAVREVVERAWPTEASDKAA